MGTNDDHLQRLRTSGNPVDLSDRMIGSLPLDNSVAFRPTKNGHKPSKPPLNTLKIDRTDPLPLVYPGEKVGNPPGKTRVLVQ